MIARDSVDLHGSARSYVSSATRDAALFFALWTIGYETLAVRIHYLVHERSVPKANVAKRGLASGTFGQSMVRAIVNSASSKPFEKRCG